MVRQRQNTVAIACGLIFALVGITTTAAAQAQPQSVQLTSQNNSGISGTATFTESAGKTRVELKVTGAGAGSQPAHIHEGSCTQLNPTPQYSLQPVTNGSSATDIDTTVAALTGSPHAIHMHKSAEELSVYVACADLTPSALPRTGDAEQSPAGMGMGVAGLSLIGLGGLVVWRARRRTTA